MQLQTGIVHIDDLRKSSRGERKVLRGPALILLAVATMSHAQNVEDHDYKLGVNVELVQLPVSVVDTKGVPVRGLKPEDFAIYEDKVLQNISLFKQEDMPLSMGLVIDASSSMSEKRKRLNIAAMTFVRESNLEDETAIVSFGDQVNLEHDFTSNTRMLKRTLNRISSNGSTALYDAVIQAARHLQESGSHEKKVLLVVSDGEDNASKHTLEEVLTTIRESKIILYSIGLLSDFPTSYSDAGKEPLKQLAEVTGGVAYFPRNVRDVEEVCRGIARDLRNQYTIGYIPSNGKLDGSWRRILVQVNPSKTIPKVRVRTKQGYYAPIFHEAVTETVIH
jgi:Ca-activated chloride channel homolog